MSDRVSNADAYQILADLLVTLRRIIHRGLVKVSGSTWYLDGCPAGLFEELVARKEKEKAIDRFEGEYQELITFASLDDLAAIIEYNSDLQTLLSTLAPGGAPMIDRLRKIEALRLKMAASVPFDDQDFETLTRYHQEFRDSLTRRKQESEAVAPPPPPVEAYKPPEDDQKAEVEHVASQPPIEEQKPIEKPKEFGTQAATFEELVEVVGGSKVPEPDDSSDLGGYSTQADTSPHQSAPRQADSDSASLAIDAELAMAQDDDREVLRVLHREVTSIAEGALRNMLDVDPAVWKTIRSSGWYDMKKADLALAPIELFYTVVTRAGDVQNSGAGLEAVKACLEEAKFSKLLLSLREMFMRHNL